MLFYMLARALGAGGAGLAYESIPGYAARALEPLGLVGARGRAIDDGAGRELPRERVEDHALAPLHADGSELDGEHVAESIHDETGELVALGVDQTKACRVLAREPERFSTRERLADALVEKRRVAGAVRVARLEGDPDRRAR